MARTVNLPVASGVLAVLAGGLAYAGTAWALQGADGVSLVDAGVDTWTYRTDFIDTPAYLLTAGSVLLLTTLAARLWWPGAVVGVAAATLALAWGAGVCVGRYVDSGWSDGLEVSIYVVPLMAAVVGGALVALAAIWRRPRRPRRPAADDEAPAS